MSSTIQGGQWLVVVTGWTGAGKSTIADALADRLGATVASFDWVMSALRCHEDVWSAVQEPVELQRRIGWDLLSRIAEQQLRGGRSCILDLVAREQPRQEWAALADRYRASFAVVECICSDVEVHQSRVDGRRREIPGWYELNWEWVKRGRQLYEPLSEPKVVIDAIEPLAHNLGVVMHHLSTERVPGPGVDA
ncbi:MAG TPA: ATP-binding protein [Acidimicrobiales bacterium]